MRKITPLIVAVGLLFTACTTTSNPQSEDQSKGLTFIHLNDIYRVGAVEDGQRGGLSRVITVVRDLQACTVAISCIPRWRAIFGTACKWSMP
jgi:hypothetical protein